MPGDQRNSNKYHLQRAVPRFLPHPHFLGEMFYISVKERAGELRCMKRACQSQLESDSTSCHDRGQGNEKGQYCLEEKANFRYQNHISKNSIYTFCLRAEFFFKLKLFLDVGKFESLGLHHGDLQQRTRF